MLDRPLSETLADLRAEIDLIDARLHELLMERGEIIDRLIAAKTGAGCAFRPEREAEMMRRLVSRHQGILPLDTVESVWRIIISTFTYVQANYSVHCDISDGDAPMRDGCRFHFGFTVPMVPHSVTADVIGAVASSNGDLGLVKVNGGATAGAWWQQLTVADAPKIIARLPFVERPDHPAGLPLFVVAKPLTEAIAHDVVLYALALERWRPGVTACLTAVGAEILGSVPEGEVFSLLIAAPATLTAGELCEACRRAEAPATSLIEIGSHAARFALGKPGMQPSA